ncbi:MAG: pyrroline-5-carboxylate reductase [Patescibacteria group bacterium]
MEKFAVLGAGHGIGLSIAEGIRSAGITKEKIVITRKSSPFSDEEKVFECTYDNKKAVASSNIIIIAVQPGQVDELLKEVKSVLTEQHLLISVVSGLEIKQIQAVVGKIPIARAMPNIAIKVKESMTSLTLSKEGEKHNALVKSIFDSVGLTLVIPENKFPEATGLFGSGPAFGLKYIRAYMQACIQNGFNEKDSLMIAIQVIKGAVMLLETTGSHPEVEIDRVTTPGGCTIRGIVGMAHAGFDSALIKGTEVCIERARELYQKKNK